MDVTRTTDATAIARLNRPIHELHVALQPAFFMPYDESAMTHAFAEAMARPMHHFYLVSVQDRTVGYIWIEERIREASAFRQATSVLYIHQISVNPEEKRKGYGRKMMEWVEQWAKARQFPAIELDYWVENEAAASFYDKVGFRPKRQVVKKQIQGSD